MELSPITINTLSPVSARINGEWLEIAIPQTFAAKYGNAKWCYFLTSQVYGREDDEVEIDSANLPKDGSIYYGQRRPSRSLKISFYIESDTRENTILAYEHLKGRLNTGKEVEIIFNDDINRYYTGVYVGSTYNGRGYNGSSYGIVGEFTMFCKDPHKYSTVVKQTTPATIDSSGALTLTIVNNGSIPAPIKFNVHFNSKSGFVGFVDSDTGKSLQFGDSTETATVTSRDLTAGIDTSQQLLSAMTVLNNTNPSDNPSDQSNTYFSERFHTGGGTFLVDSYGYLAIQNSVVNGTYIHGAGGILNIKKTDSPVVDFKVEYLPWFETYKDASQMGVMQILMVNKQPNQPARIVAGMQWLKNSPSNNNAFFYCKVNGVDRTSQQTNAINLKWNPTWESKYTQANGRNVYFEKKGATVNFFWEGINSGKIYSFSDEAIRNLETTHLAIFIGNMRGYNNWVGKANDEYIPRMRIKNLKITQTSANLTSVFEADNHYKAGKDMVVDGISGVMLYDGINQVNDEKIGSEYFMAQPGVTNVQILYSKFSGVTPPTVTAQIREGWL